MDLGRTFVLGSSFGLISLCAACAGPQHSTATTSDTVVTSTTSAPQAPASSSAVTSRVGLAKDECTTDQLALTLGEPVSEPTGQNSLLLVLTNHSTLPCFMSGYPGVTLYDASGAELPLQYYWKGDQVVTHSSPQRVDLAQGVSAYVMVNKHRCDTGDLTKAAVLRLIPPNSISTLQLRLTGAPRYFAYCGRGDPGSTLEISPVEPTEAETRVH